ncbi:hypothetical protein QBC37DRAFT_435344 [Rhypophila decipiens]|uniref:Uncharacterized protein n=1 Tax=Rhypophila decipiens TaxID=261697 RepID=A0AAN6XSZ9_9PEZI|nr:hypothetical protein QBC37DRAFT_435344 [Rhypophila decipiens]
MHSGIELGLERMKTTQKVFSGVSETTVTRLGKLRPTDRASQSSSQVPHALEDDTCFGSIINVKAQLRSPPSMSSHDEGDFLSFRIVSTKHFSALYSGPKRYFAVLNKRTAGEIRRLLDMLDGKLIRFQAFINKEEWARAEQSWKLNTACVLSVDINIYGPFNYASTIGKFLASSRTYLQKPLHGIDRIRYYC